MTFRRTRRTNDWLGWVTFGALMLAPVVMVGFGLTIHAIQGSDPHTPPEPNPQPVGWLVSVPLACFGCFAIVYIVAITFAGWQLIRPAKLEFVVEEGAIRWGRVDRCDRQQRILLTDILRIHYDQGGQRVIVQTIPGGVTFGDYHLIRDADQRDFISFIRQHHPTIRVTEGPWA